MRSVPIDGQRRPDAAGDVLDLLLHAARGEVVDLRVPAHALHAEGAGERAAAVGLDHRRELAVEELVLNAGQPGRRDVVDLLLAVPHLGAHRSPSGARNRQEGISPSPQSSTPTCRRRGYRRTTSVAEEVALAEHVDVDLRVRVEVVDLPLGSRSAGWGRPSRPACPDAACLCQAGEVEAQRLVPHVVAEHQHVGRLGSRSRRRGDPDRRTAATRRRADRGPSPPSCTRRPAACSRWPARRSSCSAGRRGTPLAS